MAEIIPKSLIDTARISKVEIDDVKADLEIIYPLAANKITAVIPAINPQMIEKTISFFSMSNSLENIS